jgi:hypothetical protein
LKCHDTAADRITDGFPNRLGVHTINCHGGVLKLPGRSPRSSLKLTHTKKTEDKGECHTETHAGGHQTQHVDGVKGFEPGIAGHVHQGDKTKDHENKGLSFLHQPLMLPDASVPVHSDPFPPLPLNQK